MKKLLTLVAVAAFMFSVDANAQEPKQTAKKSTTEKSCCASKDKKSCDKDMAATKPKEGCCASKKATAKK